MMNKKWEEANKKYELLMKIRKDLENKQNKILKEREDNLNKFEYGLKVYHFEGKKEGSL